MKLPGPHTQRQIISKVNTPFIQLVCITLSERTTVYCPIHLLCGVDEDLSKYIVDMLSCQEPQCF